MIADFFDGLDLALRSGRPCSPLYLAGLFHDQWMPCFIQLITHEGQTLAQHNAILHDRIAPLVDLLFTDACIATPLRKDTTA